jgi:hypothetical protein
MHHGLGIECGRGTRVGDDRIHGLAEVAEVAEDCVDGASGAVGGRSNRDKTVKRCFPDEVNL